MRKFILFAVAAAAFAQSVDRGSELYDQRKYGEAERVLRDVVKAEPDNARANALLGLTLINLRRAGEAEAHIRKADESSPSADTKLALARLYIEQKKLDEASAAVDEARKLDEGHRDLPFNRGMLLTARRDFEAAAPELETAIERNPTNAYAHYYAGLAYNGLKRPDKMIEHFQYFLKLAPDAPEASKVQSLLKTVR